MKLFIASACLPVVAILTAYWGATWGWNSDGKLAAESLVYIGASFVLFFAVCLAAYEFRHVFGVVTRRISSKPGLAWAVWGVYVTFVSALLTHAFDSDALWFGNVGLAYLGFVVTILAVIRMTAA